MHYIKLYKEQQTQNCEVLLNGELCFHDWLMYSICRFVAEFIGE